MQLILKRLAGRHIWKEKQEQNPTLLPAKQCWSPSYKVPILSTCGGCNPEGFIVANFFNLKYIGNNHDDDDDNNNNNNNTHNNKLSSCIYFHVLSVYFPVSIFLCHSSFFAK